MTRAKETVAVVDGILLAALSAGTIATSLVLPGAAIGLVPLMSGYTKGYDKRQRERKYRKLIMYMKRQDLLTTGPRDGNGLVLTKKGLKRARQARVDSLTIEMPASWDHNWRLVLFDIPEAMKLRRDYFTSGLRRLGMYQLQKSVWLHPYPCQSTVEALAAHYEVEPYTTFLEVQSLSRESEIRSHFSALSLQ